MTVMDYTSIHRLASLGSIVSVVFTFFACAKTAPFVWAKDYVPTAEPPAEARVVQPGDAVIVHVRGQDTLSGRFVVASDGRYRQPRLGRVEVGGFTVTDAEARLKKRLEGWLDASLIEVSVEHQPATVSVLGSVRRPGRFPITASSGLLSVLAEAGGLDDFADRDQIYVLRGEAETTRIRFRYDDMVNGAQTHFELRDQDVVVVK